MLTDEQVVRAFLQFMEDNPYATRNRIERELNVTIKRLERLGCKVPLKIHPSAAARMARRASKWGDNFKLKGTP